MSERTRLAVMVDQLRAGGAERFAVALAAELDPGRFDVTMISSRAGAWPKERDHLLGHGVDVLALGRTSTGDVGPWLRLRRFLRERRIQVLNTHMYGSNVWGSLVGGLAGPSAVIATEHSWSFEGQWLRRTLNRNLVGRLAYATVAVSTADRDRMIRIEGQRPEHVRVIPTGLVPPLSSVSEAPEDVRATIGAAADEVLLATVCTLRPEKALEVLLEAHAAARASVPVHLVIIGDGPDRARLEGISARLGADRVHFLGRRFDVMPLLRQCDLFGLSSDREGSPLALVEGMTAGLASIATRVGGVPDIAPDGECALLVPPRDPAAMAAAIVRLSQDAGERRRLGDAGQERALDRFAFPRIVGRWQDLFDEAAAARGGGR